MFSLCDISDQSLKFSSPSCCGLIILCLEPMFCYIDIFIHHTVVFGPVYFRSFVHMCVVELLFYGLLVDFIWYLSLIRVWYLENFWKKKRFGFFLDFFFFILASFDSILAWTRSGLGIWKVSDWVWFWTWIFLKI